MKKSIYRHIDPSQNGLVTLKNLVSLLDIKVTSSSINAVESQPQYPSLLTLSEALQEWGVETLGVEISKDQLVEVPLPAIAHLHSDGNFVVLVEFNNRKVKYVDSIRGWITESIDEFEKKWKGVTLIVQTNENSGEREYYQKRKLEITEQVKTISWILLCILLLVITGVIAFSSSYFLTWFTLLLVKAAGLALCIGLIFKQSGISNALVNKVCNAVKGFDCNSILTSPAAKLFGMISFSELGMLYFAGGVMSLLLASITKTPAFGALLLFNLVTLPYTIFSLYYQWRVVKVGCPFCLAIVVLFWLEFIILLTAMDIRLFFDESLIVFVGFAIPLIIWFLFRSSFFKAQRVAGLEHSLSKFKYSSNIFNALLEKQPSVEIGKFSHEIVLGNESASTTVTMVSNPICGPCSFAHLELENLLQRYPDKLKVNIRFSVNPSKNGSVDNTVAKEIMLKAITEKKENVQEALHSWFGSREKNVATWLADVGNSKSASDEVIVGDLFKKHFEWCAVTGINVTPTFFVNNKKLPEEYNVTDLKYHIGHL